MVLPFPRNWVEELLLEWLLLKGYLSSSNVLLSSGEVGGREEADVVGIKFKNRDVFEVVHVETGNLAEDFKTNLEKIRKKFMKKRVETVLSIFSDPVAPESIVGKAIVGSSAIVKAEYKRIFIASYVAKEQIDKLKYELKKDEIEFLTLEELMETIPKDIEEWKKHRKELGLTKTTKITLPEGWWLLSLIDFL